ncbi:facilitated trehalose transporter Tret1-like [Anticarsia gemmatalis]|uniref:facilitated trehalose transporter Tret1-like n=1 Tax=Anticarsia gemmatalis TaxID=129554 RepID=UPI003F76B05B
MINLQNSPLLRQYAVVIAVNLCAFAMALGLVWPSPVLVKLNNSTTSILTRPITEDEGSWIVSIGFLTGITANFLIAFLLERVGRKSFLILSCLPKFITSFMLIYATDVWMILVARGLMGFFDTFIITLVPIYASEIASKEIRGSLGTVFQIVCSFGVVTMLSVGPFISYMTLSVSYTCAIAVTTLPLLLIPDSPYSLYSKGEKSEALKVLTFLRGSEAQANEEIKEYELANNNTNTVSNKEIFKNRLFLKSLFLVVIIGLGLQLVGFNAVSFYLQTILESTQTSVKSETASVIIGMIQLTASFGTTFMTDRFGRKPILCVTCVGMALGMLGLGIFFKLKEGGQVSGFMNFVPLISLILVVYSYSAGLGSLFWVLGAELFDDKSRGTGMSIVIVSTTLTLFFITKYFAFITSAIGAAYTYWVFSINCVLLCLFIMFCIPETKGKSFAEIQDILRKKESDNVSTKC